MTLLFDVFFVRNHSTRIGIVKAIATTGLIGAKLPEVPGLWVPEEDAVREVLAWNHRAAFTRRDFKWRRGLGVDVVIAKLHSSRGESLGDVYAKLYKYEPRI